MNTVANNAQKRQNLNFYNLLTPSEILQVFMGRTKDDDEEEYDDDDEDDGR
jgi:hypothetical protein